MKLSFLLLAILLCVGRFCFAQHDVEKDLTPSAIFMDALSLYDDGNYKEAVYLLNELLEIERSNANLNFWMGLCYLELPLEKDKALIHLKEAIKNTSEKSQTDLWTEKMAPVDAHYFFAKALHKNYRFDEAIEYLDVFKLQYKIDNPEFLKDIDKLFSECETAKILMQHPVEMEVANLGKAINSPYSEHSPVFSADESVLIFTSKRESSTGGELMDDGEYLEDIYIAYKNGDVWTAPQSIGTNINTKTNEATIGLSADGQQLFIYRDDNGDGNIYVSKLEGDEWSKPEKMSDKINTKETEKHASITADGKSIYFTSARKGGYGGLDIYVVKKLPTGEWGEALNLGPTINTPYNEEGPYIHPDGVTLFFSSEGLRTMGGFDIFVTTFIEEENVWDEPVNIGYPINTVEDDVFYNPTVDGKRAYYSSCKEDGCGDNDLYMISLPGAEGKALAVFTGIVMLFNGTPPQEGYISVVDSETKEECGVYTPNSKTGKYLFILPVGKKFELEYSAENNLSHKANLTVENGTSYDFTQKSIHLPPVILGGDNLQGEYLVVFEDNKYDISEATENQLNDLADLMNNQKEISAKIMVGSDSHFKRLIKKREEEIITKLAEKGIEESRVISSSSFEKSDNNISIRIIADDTKDLPEENQETKFGDMDIDMASKGAKSTGTNVNIDRVVLKDFYYELDKFQTDEYYQNMQILADYMKKFPDVEIKLIGHCDDQGSDDYNINLSLKRAKFVKDNLVKKGVSPENIKIFGEGEKKPIANNETLESRKYNRRVEIYVEKEGSTQLVVEHDQVPEAFRIK